MVYLGVATVHTVLIPAGFVSKSLANAVGDLLADRVNRVLFATPARFTSDDELLPIGSKLLSCDRDKRFALVIFAGISFTFPELRL
ncbi:hypothetical protein QE152_g6109 [Popillia japonica]|uniref:Uncharacterized protein n=1 Tax=Popillia japonica TaxID=7064 RepID=A0AAW1MFK7_POPJA